MTEEAETAERAATAKWDPKKEKKNVRQKAQQTLPWHVEQGIVPFQKDHSARARCRQARICCDILAQDVKTWQGNLHREGVKFYV